MKWTHPSNKKLTLSSQLVTPQKTMTSTISTVNSISKTRLLSPRKGWGFKEVPGHDFNEDS